jgi:hypothetical protein
MMLVRLGQGAVITQVLSGDPYPRGPLGTTRGGASRLAGYGRD